MKLAKVQVQNFRSIVDSSAVDLHDRVTVLVGKNEQGKTTFLRGVASANPRVSYKPTDLPNHLRPSLEEKKRSEIPIVTLWLAMEDSDREKLRPIIADIDNIEFIQVTRLYDGSRRFDRASKDSVGPLAFEQTNYESRVKELLLSANGLRAKLDAHAKREAAFAPHAPQAVALVDKFVEADFKAPDQIDNLIKTLAASLASVPNQDVGSPGTELEFAL